MLVQQTRRRLSSSSAAAAASAASTRWWDPVQADERLSAREQQMDDMFHTVDSKFTLPPHAASSKHIFDDTAEPLPAKMDSLILHHLLPPLFASHNTNKQKQKHKSPPAPAELSRLRSFLGRDCLINHKFWSAEVWAKKEVELYFRASKARKEWDAKVAERRKYYAKSERVREKEWVFCDVRQVFSQKRRIELFGGGEDDAATQMAATIFGNVTRKQFGYLEVAWRVPDVRLGRRLGIEPQHGKTRPWWDFMPFQTITVIHHQDDDLETLWPEELVQEAPEDRFQVPQTRLHREDWVRELVFENRMVVFTESKSCPEYQRLISAVGGEEEANVYTVALDRGELVGLTPQEVDKVRTSITNVTNYAHFPQFFIMRMFVGGMREFDRDVVRRDDVPGGLELFLRITGVTSPDYHLKPYTRYLHRLFTLFERKWFLHERREGYAKVVAGPSNKEDSYAYMEDCYRLEREEFCDQAEIVIPFLEQRMQEMCDELVGDGEEIPAGVPLNVLLKMVYHPYFEDLQLQLKKNRRKLQKLKHKDQRVSLTGLESKLEAMEERELDEIDELEDEDGELERARVQAQIIDVDVEEEEVDGDDPDSVVFRHFKPKHGDREVCRDEDLFNDVEANERYMVQWIEEEEKFQTDEEYAMHLRHEMNAIMRSWTKEKRRDFFTAFYKHIQGKARYSAKLYRGPSTENERAVLDQDQLRRETQFQLATRTRELVKEEREAEEHGLPVPRRPSRAQLMALAEEDARKKLGFLRDKVPAELADIDNATADWEAVYMDEFSPDEDAEEEEEDKRGGDGDEDEED